MTTHHFNVAVNIGDQACAPQRVHNALSSGLRANDPSLPTFTVDVMPVDADSREQLQLAMRRIDLLAGDLEIIGNALTGEAVRRDWCAEYEAFVDKVNACTKVFDLPSRRRDWEVRHHYVVTVVGQVSALDEDQATSLAAAQFREIREALIFNLSAQDQPETGSLVDVDWSYDGARVSLEED